MAELIPNTDLSLRWSLTGKTALVTSATKGIGHAIVEELAALGAVVHITARNENGTEQCLRNWRENGYKVTGSVSDASIQDDREMLIKTVSSVFDGKLDILVNNIGTVVMKEPWITQMKSTQKLLTLIPIPSINTSTPSLKSLWNRKHCLHFICC